LDLHSARFFSSGVDQLDLIFWGAEREGSTRFNFGDSSR
jgi:hypothetical protein